MTHPCDHSVKVTGHVTSQYDTCALCGAQVRFVTYTNGNELVNGTTLSPVKNKLPTWAPPPCAPKQRREF